MVINPKNQEKGQAATVQLRGKAFPSKKYNAFSLFIFMR